MTYFPVESIYMGAQLRSAKLRLNKQRHFWSSVLDCLALMQKDRFDKN